MINNKKENKTKFISGALNQREDDFARLFVSGLKLFEAYKQSGYDGKSKNTPKKRIEKESVKKAVIYYRNLKSKRIDITERQILIEQSHIALFNPKELINPETGLNYELLDLTDNVAKCIKEYKIIETVNRKGEQVKEYQYKFYDKQKALTELSIMKAAFKPQQTISSVSVKAIEVIRNKKEDE